MKTEFVAQERDKRTHGYGIVEAELFAKFKCPCGKESITDISIELERGYYAGEADIALKIKCPCGSIFEATIY